MERFKQEQEYVRRFQREHAEEYDYLNKRMKELFFDNVDVMEVIGIKRNLMEKRQILY